MNMSELIKRVVSERIADVRFYMNNGMEIDAALAFVKAQSTLGYKSWTEVVEAVKGVTGDASNVK